MGGDLFYSLELNYDPVIPYNCTVRARLSHTGSRYFFVSEKITYQPSFPGQRNGKSQNILVQYTDTILVESLIIAKKTFAIDDDNTNKCGPQIINLLFLFSFFLCANVNVFILPILLQRKITCSDNNDDDDGNDDDNNDDT
jgi:hypothetical protein